MGRSSSDRLPGSAIEAIDLDLLVLPAAAGTAPEPRKTILISVRDGAGITGHGETVAAPGRLALARAMSACVIGRDPYHLTPLRAAWEIAGRAARAEARAVSGGVETALADLRARQLGAPLFAMLGGRRVDRVPLVRRLQARSDPAATARQAVELARLGFETLVVESTGRTIDDIASLRALRRQLGPEIQIRLDLAGQASVARARSLLNESGDLWPEMIVDPAETLAGLARLRQHAGASVAVARPVQEVAALAEAVRAEALDIWIADPIDLGGPAAFVRAAAICRTFGLDVALDARQRTEVGAALAVHLVVSHRVVNRALELAPELDQERGVLAEGLRIENGHCAVPDGPGLGIEPDPATIRACCIEHIEVAEVGA